MLAATDATDASLDCAAHALVCGNGAGIARAHALGGGMRSVGVAGTVGAVARLHLCAAVTGTLVFLESLLDGERWFSLALEVVGVVLLRHVSGFLVETRCKMDVPHQASGGNHHRAHAAGRLPPRSREPFRNDRPCRVGYWRLPREDGASG
jgi:hypothetical protein